MNLPNQLTMFRMVMIPVMIVIYLFKAEIGLSIYWILGITFVVASFTDYLDGAIARKRNIVTTFGKFMDPLADKLLVMTALMILADAAYSLTYLWMPFWFPVVILARELIVTSIRLVAVGDGKIIAASNLGKYKTTVTMGAIAWYLFLVPFDNTVLSAIGVILMAAALGLTVVSGVDYFLKNRHIILQSK